MLLQLQQLKTRNPGNRKLAIARAVALIIMIAKGVSGSLHAQSFFPQRPDDTRAVDFTKEAFGAHPDGTADDSDALQKAVDSVRGAGVVLIPDGHYHLGKTVYVWQGIRLIGYGAKRPVFVLAPNTPGFQDGTGHYLIHFVDSRPQGGGPIGDASEFTFYSGMNNIDFELQEGNPAAIAVRFHVAQHSMLTHMDFQIGSARAALEDIGNQASDIHVHGGEYGVITKRTAPVWQFLLMDSSFDGQRAAAIQTMEAGFTLVRVHIANTPVALKINSDEVDQLYVRDLKLENISDTAFVAGDWHNTHSEVTFTNIACSDVPHFYSGDEKISAPSKHYVVESFSLGLEIGTDGREQGIRLHHREQKLSNPAAAVATDIPSLPPMEKWVNVRTLGVKGDSSTDDTAALQAAIDQHQALFFPSGTYHVSDSLKLKSDTVLIGLNPGSTTISLAPGSEAFSGEGDPIGVITAPRGGSNIISSLAVGTGGRNFRAASVLWMAGPTSMLDDVSFVGGGGFGGGFGGGRAPARGTNAAAGVTNGSPIAATPAPAPRPAQGGDNSHAADLLVTDGGGGIIRGCWPHDTGARVGLRVENTSTRGRIYQISVEHHPRIETQFFKVRNWQICALQTEEENPAGAFANAMEIQDSQDLVFANIYMYRVSRNILPKEYAAIVRNSDRIAFQNVKVFSQTRLAFDNSILEEGSGVTVRAHFFNSFVVKQGMKAPAPLPLLAVFAKGAQLEKLATNFSNASGLTANDSGEIFFTDAANHKIYHWNAAAKQAQLLAEISGQPQVLGFVAPSNLLVIANEKAVYCLNIDPAAASDSAQVQSLKETNELLTGSLLLLPVGLHNQLAVMKDMMEHRGYNYRRGSNTAYYNLINDEHRGYFYAPGTKTAIMAGGTWRPNLQASQLAAFAPGDSHYLTSEDDGRTYVAKLDDYKLLSTTVFAERGGNSVVTDKDGNVYIANGQVWIYDRKGKEIGVLEVPERTGSLVFGGPDKQTLFISARSSLYSIRTKAAGL